MTFWAFHVDSLFWSIFLGGLFLFLFKIAMPKNATLIQHQQAFKILLK
jgi:F-type H+-transporting ATPase subunit a